MLDMHEGANREGADERIWARGGHDGFPPTIGPFSRGVRVGPLIFTAGMASVDEHGTMIHEGDITAQSRRTLENVRTVLEFLGASLKDVVKTTVWLKDFKDYTAMNAVYEQFFPDPAPVRACVRAEMVRPSMLVEIEAVAVVREPKPIG